MTWNRPPARSPKQIEGDIAPRRIAPSIGLSAALDSLVPLVPKPPDYLRSEAYRRFVAIHACFRCGLAGSSQCAHANEGKGMAMKVCDRRTFPLCFRCHVELDQSRGLTRDQRRELERGYVERMQAIARQTGRAEIPSI